MKCYQLEANEIVFEQGQSAVNFFILVSGHLSLIVDDEMKRVINPGEGFGELALIHDTLRTATI